MKKFYLLVAMTAVVFSMQAQVSGKENGHEYVDLGLSVKWATCNIGATSPEKYGDYFAWGETETKTIFSWKTYALCYGDEKSMTKYCHHSSCGKNGFTDNKKKLELNDDVAHVKWGGNWRMPTLKEIKELVNRCTWTWTTRNGVKGCVVKGPNGKNIFLPAAGYRDNNGLDEDGEFGRFWSSELENFSSLYASGMYFYSEHPERGWGDPSDGAGRRDCGRSVRAVCK